MNCALETSMGSSLLQWVNWLHHMKNMIHPAYYKLMSITAMLPTVKFYNDEYHKLSWHTKVIRLSQLLHHVQFGVMFDHKLPAFHLLQLDIIKWNYFLCIVYWWGNFKYISDKKLQFKNPSTMVLINTPTSGSKLLIKQKY